MRCIFVFLLYLLGVEGKAFHGNGYHMTVGIPKAFQLMAVEGQVSRIAGGSKVSSITTYPYQAGLVITLTNGLTSICGGALISNTRVLTAAHCWWDGAMQAKQFVVVLGSLTIFSGGTRITTKDVVVHSNWNTNDVTNDIAIVKITKVTFNNNIQAIALPATSDANQNFAGQSAIATGYGKNSDTQTSFPSTTSLHHVTLSIMTNAECDKKLGFSLHASHLCTSGTGKVGMCDGDSGGPLTVTWNKKQTLVGIVSFSHADGCQSGYPSVYTRVTSFLTWIQTNS